MCKIIVYNFFGLNEPEFENHASNCDHFENLTKMGKNLGSSFMDGSYFKADCFQNWKNFYHKREKLSILMPFNEFLVPWMAEHKTKYIARLETMVCNFSESFKSSWFNLLEVRLDAISWIITRKKHTLIHIQCSILLRLRESEVYASIVSLSTQTRQM